MAPGHLQQIGPQTLSPEAAGPAQTAGKTQREPLGVHGLFRIPNPGLTLKLQRERKQQVPGPAPLSPRPPARSTADQAP